MQKALRDRRLTPKNSDALEVLRVVQFSCAKTMGWTAIVVERCRPNQLGSLDVVSRQGAQGRVSFNLR